MTDAVKDVAAAIRETKVEVIHPDLYGAVMYMPGFTEEALICAPLIWWTTRHKVMHL
jgi:hypothetical protein